MNIPYNQIKSTLGTAWKYAKPYSAYAAVGAAVGGIGYAAVGNKTGVGLGIAAGGAAALLHERYNVKKSTVNNIRAAMDRMRAMRRGL